MAGWKRIAECPICGNSRCSIKIADTREIVWCFRHNRSYYRQEKRAEQPRLSKKRLESKKIEREQQLKFSFSEKHWDPS